MDLVSGAERVIVLVDHVSKSGAAKLGLGYEVSDRQGRGQPGHHRLGVFDVTGTAFAVVELADGVEYDDVVDGTGAPVTDSRRACWRRSNRFREVDRHLLCQAMVADLRGKADQRCQDSSTTPSVVSRS